MKIGIVLSRRLLGQKEFAPGGGNLRLYVDKLQRIRTLPSPFYSQKLDRNPSVI